VTHEEFIAAEKRVLAARQAHVHMQHAISALTQVAQHYEKAGLLMTAKEVTNLIATAKEIN
jgi:hypothetical protein